MKIGITYINASNYGDQIIFSTARYLMEKCLRGNGVKDYDLVSIDICIADRMGIATPVEYDLEEALEKDACLDEEIKSTEDNTRLKELYIDKWHNSRIYREFKFYQIGKIDGIDLLYVCGGGLIKFHQQHYHYMLHELTKRCDELGIPVIMSGLGVEGYNGDNAECMILKDALNRKCVKYISVRDDFETLKNCYITNPDITIEKVADPAFWTKEKYRVEAKPEKGLVGLNTIRKPIWALYGYPVDTDKLEQMYFELTERLIENGYRVEFFSNGVRGDRNFTEDLKKDYPDLKGYIGDGRVTVFEPSQPPDLVKRISMYERYMAVRLHSAIVGTVLGVPNISLVWNKKQPLFGQQTGTEENFIMPDDFNTDNVYGRLVKAGPWVMDQDYKMTVYNGINLQIRKFLNGDFNV